MTPEQERALWMNIRQGILMIVDAIERVFNMTPRTSELRKERKGNRE